MKRMRTINDCEQWLTDQVSVTITYDYEYNFWRCNVKYTRYYPHISNYPLEYAHTMNGKTMIESIHNVRCLIDREYRYSTDPKWSDRMFN